MATRGRPRIATYETVYTFVLEFKTTHQGDSPSKQDIQSAMGWTGGGSVTYALQRLEQENKIRCTTVGRRLYIEVIGAKWVPP